MMDKDKFDYYWRIALIIVLILGLILTIAEFKDISRKGVACISNPFIYGAKIMSGKQNNGHMFCTCQVYGDDYVKQYSFNELQQNPNNEINSNLIPNNYNFSLAK